MNDFSNKEIAKILRQLADLLEINGANRFRIRAYYNASRKILDLGDDLKNIVRDDKVKEIQGIGEGIANTIKEIYAKGYCSLLEEIKAGLPVGVLELIKIPGLGPKKAHSLFYELEIQSIEEFKEALRNGKVNNLKGFGPKTIKKFLNSIEEYESNRETIILYDALDYSREFLGYLKNIEQVKYAQVVGSVRRKVELVQDIDILVACEKKQEVRDFLVKLPVVAEIISEDEKKITVLTGDHIKVDLIFVPSAQFPTSLQYYTGSKAHNICLRERAESLGYHLKEEGLFQGDRRIVLETELDLYQALKLKYIMPELREDRGEIKAALEGKLPQSITLRDIKGDLHIHTSDSDGAFSLEEMVEAAYRRGYQYLAITDHSQSLRVAHGLTSEALLQQIRKIEVLQRKYTDIRILKGVEVDIKNDGSLDYPDDILAQLDLVIASIHSGFNQSEEQITFRLIKAMENSYVDIIGHPQGRLLKRRRAYKVDLDKVILHAAKTGTCLEINSSPYRLDLDDLSVIKAKKAGVKIAINTDSHHVDELTDMALGVSVGRRGWLEKNDVINTMELDDLLTFLRSD